MCDDKRNDSRLPSLMPTSREVVSARTVGEPDGLQQAIGEYLFSIAATECPDAARRWERVVEHIAAWLLDEWEHERGEHGNPLARK
jgi:hypothetical protein